MTPIYSHGTKADLKPGDGCGRIYVVSEITESAGRSPELLQEMRAHLERLKQQGVEAIEE